MVIDELLIALGFELDESSVKDLRKFQEEFEKAAVNVAKLTASLAAGSAALVAFTKIMSDMLDDLAKTARG